MRKRSSSIVVYATFPHLKTAQKIIQGLITKKFAVCGNIFKLSSIYTWQGKIEKSPEYGALIKTRMSQYKNVEAYIKKHHPYTVPEIISWPIEKGSKEYLNWIETET
ncbi:MAG: divalent-cation tolerance protein CutA [candidate division WOR-3 bacterium]|nr:MAG: divalent-cation tolerance protein CutA [candidate division WOR-3 bacterium]